jgi:hypothetical protein
VRRSLLRISTLLSTLFLLASVSFWIYSCFFYEMRQWSWLVWNDETPTLKSLTIGSGRGAIYFEYDVDSGTALKQYIARYQSEYAGGRLRSGWMHGDSSQITYEGFWNGYGTPNLHFGFDYDVTQPILGIGISYLLFPWLVPAVLFAILPLLSLRRVLKSRRQDTRRLRGQCPKCGYDIRASPEVCPECGHPAPAATAPAR